MRVAVLADIHGNSIALDAVLADIASAGESILGIWILGDSWRLAPIQLGYYNGFQPCHKYRSFVATPIGMWSREIARPLLLMMSRRTSIYSAY